MNSVFFRRNDGESRAFEELVSQQHDRLYRVAFRMAGDHDDAQDLLQDALIEAYRAFAHFKRGTYFDKWLYRIMSRTFIDRQRAKRRAPTWSLDEPVRRGSGGGEIGSLDVPDCSGDPGYRIEQEHLAEPLQKALDSLSPDFRIVVIMADIEDFSYEEIAKIVGCPVGTVRSRLHRARLTMAKYLESRGFLRGGSEEL